MPCESLGRFYAPPGSARFSLQGKVAAFFKVRRTIVVLVVWHYFHDVACQKSLRCI